MIVYHGSIQPVIHPDVLHSYRPLDFGMGFYVTTNYNQAVKWAKRKAAIYGVETAIVNTYVLKALDANINVKTFNEDLADWIDFVCMCRDGGTEYKKYDLIIGKVADDQVFRVVDMYHSGIWDRDRALKEIKVYPTYDQIAFITQKAIDDYLLFQSADEV
ncbi:MAG: DUF3990 domain-containing protein [Dorea sp.]|nr:DUF3990 domain-containing protein [Dorea sp.]